MTERKYHLINRRELIIIFVLFIIAAAAAVLPKIFNKGAVNAVIRCGDMTETLNLSSSGEFTFDEFGNTVFEVSGGKIRIKNASCPDKICEKTGFIGFPGQSIICVPERITVTIENSYEESDSIDAAVG